MRHSIAPLALLLTLLVTIATLGIELGSVRHASDLILSLRFARVEAGFFCGGSLALAGVVLQALLKNPLADPFILGISSGAAVASLLGMLAGLSSTWLGPCALLGAFVTLMALFYLSHGFRAFSPLRLLLTGVILASGLAAVISFILTIAPSRALHPMLFWLMGDLSTAQIHAWHWGIFCLCLALLWHRARALDLLCTGELQARSLGVDTKRLHLELYFISALLTALVVSLAGAIGFVGLVVPHLLRLWHSSGHRFLIPASVLAGGSLVIAADLLARTLFSPLELPVGILLAIIGSVLFLVVLRKNEARLC